jgi:inositol-phosphate phosphatase/L-galactose 1-phosphate phosphatase/histidinol-phosphatase
MEDFLEFANYLADTSGIIAKKYFRQNIKIDIKGEISSPAVTKADLEIEKTFRNEIAKKFPEHNILGEEFDKTTNNSKYTWVIDPIDGTTAFICGKPLFTTLISLFEDGESILGIVDEPISNERWCGAKGKQTTLNNIPCFTNKNPDLKALRLNCTTPFMFSESEYKKYELVAKISKIKSFGGDAYAYALLSSGFIEIVLESDLKIYDVAPLIPIIKGAGGIITDWQNQEINLKDFNGTALASCNKEIHKMVLNTIN